MSWLAEDGIPPDESWQPDVREVCTKPSEVVNISGAELTALPEENHSIGYRVFQSRSHIIGARLRDVEQALVAGQT